MIDNNVKLADSKNDMDENIDSMQHQIQKSMNLTKAQENLHEMILEYEIE